MKFFYLSYKLHFNFLSLQMVLFYLLLEESQYCMIKQITYVQLCTFDTIFQFGIMLPLKTILKLLQEYATATIATVSSSENYYCNPIRTYCAKLNISIVTIKIIYGAAETMQTVTTYHLFFDLSITLCGCRRSYIYFSIPFKSCFSKLILTGVHSKQILNYSLQCLLIIVLILMTIQIRMVLLRSRYLVQFAFGYCYSSIFHQLFVLFV